MKLRPSWSDWPDGMIVLGCATGAVVAGITGDWREAVYAGVALLMTLTSYMRGKQADAWRDAYRNQQRMDAQLSWSAVIRESLRRMN